MLKLPTGLTIRDVVARAVMVPLKTPLVTGVGLVWDEAAVAKARV